AARVVACAVGDVRGLANATCEDPTSTIEPSRPRHPRFSILDLRLPLHSRRRLPPNERLEFVRVNLIHVRVHRLAKLGDDIRSAAHHLADGYFHLRLEPSRDIQLGAAAELDHADPLPAFE